MKRKLYFLILFCAICFNFYSVSASEVTAETDKDNNPKILFIGNSFTYKNSMPDMFANLSNYAGYHPDVTFLTKGEWSLEKFADPTDIYGQQVYFLLSNEKWDYVILQDQSKMPVTSPMTSTYPAVKTLNTLIKKAGAKAILFMTWGYDNHTTFYIDGLNYYLSANQMQNYLTKNYFYVGNSLGIPVSPVGIGFNRCKNLFPEISLYNETDLYHPSTAGSYLTACTLFTTIYGTSPLGNSYTSNLNQSTALKLQEIADRRISLNKTNLNLNRADSTNLTAKVTVSSGNSSIKDLSKDTVYWSSLDDTVASVDYNTGKITGIHAGTTMIKAYTNSGLVSMCNVTVKQPASSISLSNTPIKITQGKSSVLTASIMPSDSTDSISWSSSNSSVATVTSKGKVLALSPGVTKITARTSSGKAATCKVYTRLKTPKITKVSKTPRNYMRERVNITTRWNKVDGAIKYYVYRSKRPTSGYSLIAKTRKTKFIDRNKPRNKKYYYKIVAVNTFSGCKSDKSNPKAI